jgi:hypothetical protein
MSVFVWEGGNKTMPNMNYPESDYAPHRKNSPEQNLNTAMRAIVCCN